MTNFILFCKAQFLLKNEHFKTIFSLLKMSSQPTLEQLRELRRQQQQRREQQEYARLLQEYQQEERILQLRQQLQERDNQQRAIEIQQLEAELNPNESTHQDLQVGEKSKESTLSGQIQSPTQSTSTNKLLASFPQSSSSPSSQQTPTQTNTVLPPLSLPSALKK